MNTSFYGRCDSSNRSCAQGGVRGEKREFSSQRRRFKLTSPLDLPRSHRQQGLRAIERLYLAFLIDTQHNSAFGWRQVKPDDIANFLDERRICRELESLDAVRCRPIARQMRCTVEGA